MLNICHYVYGLEPYRTGGSISFATFLIEKQSDTNNVFILYPGHYSRDGVTLIKESKALYKSIKAYELTNPKPIPICNGILDINPYVNDYSLETWDDFFDKTQIDIIHVHTLFGLDRCFFESCRNHNIKTIFTSHDIFGICPKAAPLLFDYCNGKPSELCSYCSKNAFSEKQNKILQSNAYLKCKNSSLIKLLRKIKRNKRAETEVLKANDEKTILTLLNKESRNYKQLQDYYMSLVNMFDCVHFNSKMTKDLFLTYSQPKTYFVEPVFHKNIKDNRKKHTKVVDPQLVKLLILGTGKGMFTYLDVLDEIWNEGIRNFALDIYSSNDCEKRPYLSKHGPYKINELDNIYNSSDILLFKENTFATFSFIVYEAISYGVPCILSGPVGIKDLVEANNLGFVTDNDKEKIKEQLIKILNNHESIKEKQQSIINCKLDFNGNGFFENYKKYLYGK